MFTISVVTMMVGSLLGADASQGQMTPMAVRLDLEQIATSLPYFDVDDFVFNRPGLHGLSGVAADEYRRSVSRLASTSYPFAELIELLKHHDPKVRTLAAGALYAHGNPQMLPHFVDMANDNAPSFQEATMPVGLGLGEEVRPALTDRGVAWYTDFFLKMYLNSAGYEHGRTDFDKYWAPRKDRSYCSSWFGIRLIRATGGIQPTQPGRAPQIRAVRGAIEALPQPDRTWQLLALYGKYDYFISEAQMTAMCRDLGAEKLIPLLERKVFSDDPDLLPASEYCWKVAKMQSFILEHAKQLLRPQDADLLLARERWERNDASEPNLTPWWIIGAAELQPGRARRLLLEAIQRYDWKPQPFAAALWRIEGPPAMDLVVDWYYTAKARPLWDWLSAETFFSASSEGRNIRENRLLAASLVADPRFQDLDWSSTKELLSYVELLAREQLVDPVNVSNVFHPLRERFSGLRKDSAEAMQKWPKETEAVVVANVRWKRLLEQATKDWSKP